VGEGGRPCSRRKEGRSDGGGQEKKKRGKKFLTTLKHGREGKVVFLEKRHVERLKGKRKKKKKRNLPFGGEGKKDCLTKEKKTPGLKR